MSIRFFILGSLAKQPCHPYIIKKVISEFPPDRTTNEGQ